MTDSRSSAGQKLLEQIRCLAGSETRALDAATVGLSDAEKLILSTQLARIATYIAACVEYSGAPPPHVLPGNSSGSLALSAHGPAVLVATHFVRNTLHGWGWADVLVDAERATRELTTTFVTAMAKAGVTTSTRMTLRLRAPADRRLLIELRDSAENAHVIEEAGDLITEQVERISVRSGQFRANGRTVLWCELARPELSRWI